ncbi:uncharacterized protein LOC131954285 [Physella acuta]|uniref:uncharacterized protein LOC131954285 n=1 Tax=Physella acuta TaxID=109671 RepID=UPI0027DBC8D1|nr:uncharacterized protein LOC131954285 [Physella acuta]
MVGKTGNGKSSTANSILQLDAFKKSDDLTSCTYLTMSASVKRKELEIKVVDSPGYMDPDEKREIDNIDIQIPGIMSVCSEGIHAMLLVFKYGNRFTKEEFDTVCKIKEMFGKNILKDHGIIVFTFGENFDMTNEQIEDRGEDPITFETWCRKQDGAIQNLFTECDNRIVLVYNSVLGRFKEKNKESVKQLMNIAVEMRKKGAYTNEMFEKCKLEREKIIVKYELLELDISFQRKLDFLIQHINKFKQSNTMTEDDLIQLKRRGKDLLNKVDTISKDTRLKNILKEKVNKILKHLGEINLNQPIAEQMMSLLKSLDTLKNPPIPVETGAAILARLINIVRATSQALGFGSLSFTDRLLHGILSNMNSKPKVKSA